MIYEGFYPGPLGALPWNRIQVYVFLMRNLIKYTFFVCQTTVYHTKNKYVSIPKYDLAKHYPYNPYNLYPGYKGSNDGVWSYLCATRNYLTHSFTLQNDTEKRESGIIIEFIALNPYTIISLLLSGACV